MSDECAIISFSHCDSGTMMYAHAVARKLFQTLAIIISHTAASSQIEIDEMGEYIILSAKEPVVTEDL